MIPEEIEALGYGNEIIWLDLEQEIINDIARRIKETGVVTRTADYQLNQLQRIYGYSDKQITELLKKTITQSDEYVDEVLSKAVKTDYIDNKNLYKATGKTAVPYDKNAVIQSLVYNLKAQCKGEINNISKTLGFVVNGTTGKKAVALSAYYKSLLDDAILQVTSGGFDSKTSLKKAVSQLTNSGLRWIDYDSGHHSRVTVAARRGLSTALTQLTKEMSDYHADQLGCDIFEVAWHANARPTHREWHGQVWTKEQLVTVCGLGSVEGLCGANCYHVYYPFIQGLSKRNWSDEWLAEQNKLEDTPKTFNGKEYTSYEATQRQRVIETRMRAQREAIQALKEGDADPLDIMFMQAKYRASMDEYVKFSKAMGLCEQHDRIYIDGKGVVGAAKRKGVYSKEEYGALMNYISSDSYKINEKLRTGAKLSDQEKEFVHQLDSVLSKTKNYKGEVNRSISFMYEEDIKEFISQHITNYKICYQQYLSATTERVYNDVAQVQLHILSKHGKDIRKYNQREQEILFDRYTVFTIKAVEDKDSAWHIWLEEVIKSDKKER